MATKRFAYAIASQSNIKFDQWMDEIRVQHDGAVSKNYVNRVASTVLRRADPNKYLLSHATIVGSVDTYAPKKVKTGRRMSHGVQIDVKYPDFRIKPNNHKIINNNKDCWERSLLLSTYRTFIGAPNYLEHIQLPALSKGFIIDAIARDLGDTCYVDILVGTDRKHVKLINDILSEEISALSMGCISLFTICTKCGNVAEDDAQTCFPPGTQILTSDGTYKPIEEIVVGDMVLSHTGVHRPVTATTSRHYCGDMVCLDVEGVPSILRSTPEHPYYLMRPVIKCSCGCGLDMKRTIEHERGSVKSYGRRFLPGHNSRVDNPHSSTRNLIRMEEIFDAPQMEFVQANDVKHGDYVAMPIPQESVQTHEATENRARLLGYFLAEGCYLKRNGERVGVCFSLGAHEVDTLASEIKDLLNIEFGGAEKPALDWKLLLDKKPLVISRCAKSNFLREDTSCPRCCAPRGYVKRCSIARVKLAECKLCGRTWNPANPIVKQARLRHVKENSLTVTMSDKAAAKFFFDHCGEYSYGKKLSRDAMLWPPEIQKHILATWLNGDGSQDVNGVRGNSVSYDLASQMAVIAARCGYYTNRSVTFGEKSVEAVEVVNGGQIRDDRNWLPQFSITISKPDSILARDTRFNERPESRKMSGLFSRFKKFDGYIMHRIRKVWIEQYHGDVFNFEVAADHSYIVDGIAVHNCPCITYEGKGSPFDDEDGVQHPIAELIGHVTVPNSNQFIEASWVKNPAFVGAVRRNFINPDTDVALASKIDKASSVYELKKSDLHLDEMKRAASILRMADDQEEADPDPPDPSAGTHEAPDTGADEADQKELGGDEADLADAADQSSGAALSSPPLSSPSGGGGMEPPDDADKDEEKDSGKGEIDELLGDAQRMLVENLVKSLEERLAPKPEDVKSVVAPVNWESSGGNDNIVRSSQEFSKRLRQKFDSKKLIRWAEKARMAVRTGGKRAIASEKMSARDLIILSWIEDCVNERQHSPDLYKVAMGVGAIAAYPSEKSFIAACRMKLGRALTDQEKRFFIWKGKIASLAEF